MPGVFTVQHNTEFAEEASHKTFEEDDRKEYNGER